MSDYQVLERLTALQQKLKTQRNDAKRDLDEIDRQLQAVITTLDLLQKDQSQTLPSAGPVDALVGELRTKKTQVQALVAIARHNNGTLRTKEAKLLLQRSGLMKQTKNASNILYNVINRSERFRHIGPGEYLLKESKPATEAKGFTFETPIPPVQ